jgi:hypothetical protein
MNSSTSEAVWLTPGSAHQLSLHHTDTQVVFETTVALAILTATETGLFTCSSAVGSTPSQDVQYVVALLNQGGYQAAVTGTNLVVSW